MELDGKLGEKQQLESRVYQLEQDLNESYLRIAELEIKLNSLAEVAVARCQLHVEVLGEKVEAIGDALKHVLKDLITEDKERPKTGQSRKIKIIRRQNLTPDKEEESY